MGVSIRPSEFVEGGVVPVNKNLLWKECRFVEFFYTMKDGSPKLNDEGQPASAISAQITYLDDDGNESVQQYSAGSPKRFAPSADGKTLVALTESENLSKSSNYYILMNALVNAGFPENKVGEDISVLDGLYTYNIELNAPKRGNLDQEPVEGARPKVLSVPANVLKLPGENKGKSATKSKAPEDAGDAEADALALVTQMLAESDSDAITRQQVSSKLIKAKKNSAATLVFKPEFAAILTEAGFSLDKESISIGE